MERSLSTATLKRQQFNTIDRESVPSFEHLSQGNLLILCAASHSLLLLLLKHLNQQGIFILKPIKHLQYSIV